MNKINLLYVGSDDFTMLYSIPAHVRVKDIEEASRNPAEAFDIVILDRNLSETELDFLFTVTKGYCLFATERVDLTEEITASFYKGRMGQILNTGDIQKFLNEDAHKYFGYSYGEKYIPGTLVISKFFKGSVESRGSFSRMLEGDFGEDFTQIAYWRYNIPVPEGQSIDFFLEYKKHGTVEIKLRVVEFNAGSVDDIKCIKVFNEDELQSVVTIGGEAADVTAFVSVLAKGSGKLEIISLHDRYSRMDKGYFIPGGKRHVSPMGEEFFTYFEKGDCKPPLLVYFSGYRTKEGFEGYHMMRSFHCPFLLITDPRQEGGAYYIGDAEYERMLTSVIKDAISELGFTKKDVVFSGASMGTYGALYYGARLMPHALVLAKPLVNMGNVAINERIVRTEGFGTSIDLLKKNYNSLDKEAVESFNQRLWDEFEEADWSETKFIISYLYEDDYDPDGYQSILKHLSSSGVQVYGKGNHGRHTDNSASVMAWFKSRYTKLLEEDFGR